VLKKNVGKPEAMKARLRAIQNPKEKTGGVE